MTNQDLMLQRVIEFIEQADDLEIERIMEAVERRYAIAFPEWDVSYTAVHKDPALRRKELEELVVYIEKDLKWNEEQPKKDSLG